MRWLRTEIWSGSGVSPLFFIGLAMCVATSLLASCGEACATNVLYADQPAVHVVRVYSDNVFGRDQCDSDRDHLAYRHPTITFHCNREVYG